MAGGISIALATLDGARFLPAQLDSLAAQTVPPVELVVTDDGSGDDTIAILRDFAVRAPFPVQMVQNETRLGFRDNFFKAAGLCRGDLIAFCDQDDIWDPHKLATMMTAFEQPDVLLAFHNAALIDGAGHVTGALHRRASGETRFGPLALAPFWIVPGFTQVFRRDLLAFGDLHPRSRDVDAPGDPLPHDRWFLFLASALGTVVWRHERLVRYRQHGGNAFGRHRDWLVDVQRFLRGARHARAAAKAADLRAAILETIATQPAGEQAAHAEQAAAFYRALAARHATRAQWLPFGR